MRTLRLGTSSGLGIIALVAWIVILRPVPLGGPASYMLVSGHSMEPTMYTGDLAVLQRQEHYAVGDVIAFPVQQGALVIHRIVGGDSDHGFVMQGDNKDAPDDWRPTDTEILGKLWIHAPGVGRAMGTLRESPYLPIILGVLGLSLLAIDDHKRPASSGSRRANSWSEIPSAENVSPIRRTSGAGYDG